MPDEKLACSRRIAKSQAAQEVNFSLLSTRFASRADSIPPGPFERRDTFKDSRSGGSEILPELVPRRLLVVATASVPEADLRARVHAHAGEDAQILVIAPASNVSRLDWLTNDEDDVRAEAAERAEEIGESVPTDDFETRVGDSDPIKAIEDALRTFAADEIIVVTHTHEDAEWLEEGSAEEARSRFSQPLTHLVVEK